MSLPTHEPVHWRSRALLGGLGYVCLFLVAGSFAGVPVSLGPSLVAVGIPVLVTAALGTALLGGFVAVLSAFGLRSPLVFVLVAAVVAVLVEATSLRPSFPSLFGTWAVLAPPVVALAAVEYGLRRAFGRRESGVRGSQGTERALFGGGLAALCLLGAFSFRGVGPLAMLSPMGLLPSSSALVGVLAAFGPPTLLVGASATLVFRYGLLTPLVSIPVVLTLLANPLGVAFSLFTAASPLILLTLFALAVGEYALRSRFRSVRPRSLVG